MKHKFLFVRLSKEPEDLPSVQNAITVFEQLTHEILEREEEFPLINDQILTLDKYSVHIPEEIRNLEKNIPTEWRNYLFFLTETEKMLEYSKVLTKEAKK